MPESILNPTPEPVADATEPGSASSETSSTTASSSNSAASSLQALSVIAIIAAIIFAGVGLYKLYDDSYTSKVVGGDAYNFIIYATRGTAYVCAGIVCAVLSVTLAVFGHTASTRRS